jgi:hypothetical protein
VTAYIYKESFPERIMKKVKKSREEIKRLIITELLKKPLSIQQISKKLSSNWSTIFELLGELKKEGKIREVISTEKIKIYKATDYPVFYSLPIQEKHRKLSLFLFSEIANAWKKKYNTTPPATTIQKVAVDVVKESGLDIPVLPFHYGLVLPIFSTKDSTPDKHIPENSKEIKSCIEKILPAHTEKAWREEINQYKKYNMSFFLAKNKLALAFESQNKKEIESAILRLSWEFPNDESNSIIFSLFDKFVYCSIILLNWKNYKSDLSELKGLYEGIWDLITSNMFLNEAKEYILKEDMPLFEIIRTSTLNSKISPIEEKLLELEPFVNSINPEEIETPMDEESIKIREILTENADYE